MKDVDAYKVMSAKFRAVLDARAVATVGYLPEVRYEAVNYREAPDNHKVWIQFGIRFEGSRRTTIGRVANYETRGEIWCELNAPVKDNSALEKTLLLASDIRDAYRVPETSYPLRFRETNIRTLQSSLIWNTRRVSVSFEFDDRY